MISISLNSIVNVEAKWQSHGETSWVDLKFSTYLRGDEDEITVFFRDRELAQRFAKAVNASMTAPEAATAP